MNERELRGLIAAVRADRCSRRAFVRRMVGFGLTAPLANLLLADAGVAQIGAGGRLYKPTKRGGGGPLKVLWWQAPTLLNPHFAVGTKDQDGSRIFYEPLAAWDADGNLVPVLAAEIPSLENGGARRRRQVGHLEAEAGRASGTTASRSPPTTSSSTGNTPPTRRPRRRRSAATRTSRSRRSTTTTVRVVFAKPTPFWADAFVGVCGMIIPKHLFEAYKGAKSRDAPTNLKPVGTGPYKFVDFKPGDLVSGEINPNYHSQPAVFRHDRDEGRRRRGVGGARGAADRRIRLSPGTCRSRTRS